MNSPAARLPGTSNADIMDRRAENAKIWGVEGRRWIDFCAGIAVLNTSHRHPRKLAAVTGA